MIQVHDRPILLLGAGGQLGRALHSSLARLGAVVALTRVDVDLESVQDLRRVVRAARPRLLVNAAAYTAVDAAETDEARCGRVNDHAPGVLAEETANLEVPLIHFSTNYVFDGTLDRPYREEDVVCPLGVYGRSKAQGEERVRAANPAHVILRTNGLYGGAIGPSFVRRMLELAREREELRVVDDQRSAPTAVPSLAAAVGVVAERVLEAPDDPALAGVFHLTATGQVSWYDFARRILELDPRREEQRVRRIAPIKSHELTSAASRPANGVLDVERIAERFGIQLPPWEVDLARTLRPMAATG